MRPRCFLSSSSGISLPLLLEVLAGGSPDRFPVMISPGSVPHLSRILLPRCFISCRWFPDRSAAFQFCRLGSPCRFFRDLSAVWIPCPCFSAFSYFSHIRKSTNTIIFSN